VTEVSKIIAKAQITNGGPVILLQPENEYTPLDRHPVPEYMNAVYKQYRDAGIVVPFVSNDYGTHGFNAPGGDAPVDIYGHDGYPMEFDCTQPDKWRKERLRVDYRESHVIQSSSTPYTVPEFQGGSFDPWGGVGWDDCIKLTDVEFERVHYKNMFSFGITIFNIYMTFGGTNWANLGHPKGYTSYDYGTVISEDRGVLRPKYSEAKLIATFVVSSPEYLEATPDLRFSQGTYTTSHDVAATRLKGKKTQFLVLRLDDFHLSNATANYRIKLPDSNLTVPQNGDLILRGRDAKMLVVDYAVGDANLAYSTAEIFTRQSYQSKAVLVVYADHGDSNELAFSGTFTNVQAPDFVKVTTKDGLTIVNWTTQGDALLILDKVHVYLVGECFTVEIFADNLERKSAYKMWVLAIPDAKSDKTPYTGTAKSHAIIVGGDLMRNVTVDGKEMHIRGDHLSGELQVRVLGGAPEKLERLFFNSKPHPFDQDDAGVVTFKVDRIMRRILVPNLSKMVWKSIDSLPELHANYSDSKWTVANKLTRNIKHPLKTPFSLYASDYGFHLGYMLFRGTFKATGKETKFNLTTRGGLAYGDSVWIGDKFLGSWNGIASNDSLNSGYDIQVEGGKSYTFTILIDNMGHDQNWEAGEDDSKAPLGILDYELAGRPKDAISWKLAGNFGGEDYPDRARGPTNEGGLFAERQGYHLPNPPTDGWKDSIGGPMEGLKKAGVAFYTTTFNLTIADDIDLPTAIVINSKEGTASYRNTQPMSSYRLQIYVNGWQFGKYVHNIGPQFKFPVPPGIWNTRGVNTLAMTFWNLAPGEVQVDNIALDMGPNMGSGYGHVEHVDSPGWTERDAF
jgi:hypothetical protein